MKTIGITLRSRRCKAQRDKITELRRALEVEKTLTNALSHLALHPKQDTYRLGMVRKALRAKARL